MQIPSCLQILHNSSTLFHHRAFFRGRVYFIRLRYKYLSITSFIIWPHFSSTCWPWDIWAGPKDEYDDSFNFPNLYHLSLFVYISHIPLVFGILEKHLHQNPHVSVLCSHLSRNIRKYVYTAMFKKSGLSVLCTFLCFEISKDIIGKSHNVLMNCISFDVVWPTFWRVKIDQILASCMSCHCSVSNVIVSAAHYFPSLVFCDRRDCGSMWQGNLAKPTQGWQGENSQ